MPEVAHISDSEIRLAFQNHERAVRVQNFRVACILAFIFMPAGISLDFLVYPEHMMDFLQLRLLCSALLLFIWWLVKTPLGSRYYRVLGLILPALPTLFISIMIYRTQGPDSPYYAGLNLVLLGASIILRWSLLDSLIVFFEVIGLYLAACLMHGWIKHFHIFYNNFYFLFVTGVFVVIGSYFYNRLRFREFALRFELNKNKQELEQSHQKLLELDQVKSRFFANVSHELRTPLTLLMAPLETLSQRFGRSIDEETRDLLTTMHANGMRLLKLINDLLDLVRLESGRMEVKREPMDVADFIRGMSSSVQQVAKDKHILLQAAADPALGSILTDRDKLEKIVLNLVFNALKFTPAGGRIELHAAKGNDHLILSVKDTGMGISEKHLPHVFDRFWQADDSSRRKYQGLGIGLALVKELVEVQGGEVSVASQHGKGTTFTVRLPFVPADVPAGADVAPALAVETKAPVATAEWLTNLYRRAELFPAMTSLRETVLPVEMSQNSNRPKVLVADDEPDMLRFLKSQLSPHCHVLEAVDGLQAIEKATQFLPDIILMDMMMPEKDGVQACRELRQRTSTQSIPIVLITARADEETKLAALEAGASDFLPKPFSTTELHVRVKNLVDSFNYQRKLARQNQQLNESFEQLKATETQLVQHEKLASLGRMSAGIIHEINNPLNFASTGLYTLRNKAKYLSPEQRPEYSEILNDVEEGLKRIKNIVLDLRSFSHHENDLVEPLKVVEILQPALRFLSHEWRDQVRLELSVPEQLKVWGNKNKFIQVIVNLVQNSIDALRQKQFGSGETPTIWITGKETQGRSILQVRDNGDGIDAKHVDKIFDPFFTTKDVGKGMGLGLSIVYRIVEEFEGSISVRSEPGQYCEFTLEFPVKGGA